MSSGSVRPASESSVYRWYQMILHVGLFHISQGSRFHACLELSFCVYCKKHEYFCGARCSEFVQSVNSTQNRHGYVSDDEIRVEAASFRHQCRAIGDCCYDIKIGRQESNFSFERRSVVIGQ